MKSGPFSKLGSFEIVTIANGISKVGNQFYYLAAPLYLLKETHSAIMAALFLSIQSVPYLLSSFIGIFIDKFNKRCIYILSEGIQLLSMLFLSYLIMGGNIKSNILLFGGLVFFVQMCSITSSIILEYSILPSLARDNRITVWNSVYVTFMNSCRMIGPILAGVAIEHAGEHVALIVNAITFLGTAGIGAFLPEFKKTKIDKEVTKKKRDGVWEYLFKIPELLRLTVGLGIYNLGVGGLTIVVMTLLKVRYNLSSFYVGMAITISGVASILGNIWAKGNRSHTTSGVYNSIKNWIFICALASLFLLVPNPYMLYVGYFGISFSEGVINVFSMTYRQQIIPKNLTGRLNGLIRTIIMGPVPISFIIYGLALSHFRQIWVSFGLATIFIVFSTILMAFRRKKDNICSLGDGF